MDNNDEDAILIAAELILDAVGPSEAMLACDFEEARFRARLVQSHSLTAGKPSLLHAAARVITLLGSETTGPLPGYAEAINALSLEIDRLDVGSEGEV